MQRTEECDPIMTLKHTVVAQQDSFGPNILVCACLELTLSKLFAQMQESTRKYK